jgi:hypothetical protein
MSAVFKYNIEFYIYIYIYIHVVNVACYDKDIWLAGVEDILQKMKRKEIPLEGPIM